MNVTPTDSVISADLYSTLAYKIGLFSIVTSRRSISHIPVAVRAYVKYCTPVTSSTRWDNNIAFDPSAFVMEGGFTNWFCWGATIKVTSAYFSVAKDNLPELFNFNP